MKKKKMNVQFLGKFKSIQSTIFTGISLLVLCAVLVVTIVSLQYTRSSIFENSVMYTKTIINQMDQNIDSYIDYMENIASLVSGSEDVQEILFQEEPDEESVHRLREQFNIILKGRSDIKNLGVLNLNGNALINDGSQEVNPFLDIEEQEWYQEAIKGNGDYNGESLFNPCHRTDF